MFRPSIKRDLLASEMSAVASFIIRTDAVSLFTNSDKCQSVIRTGISLSDIMSACQYNELDRNQEVLNAFDEILHWKRGPQDNKDRLRLRFAYVRLITATESLKPFPEASSGPSQKTEQAW